MDYSAYDTADFVCDDSFVAWVKEGRDGAHWEQVIKQYPDKQEQILQARAIILAAAQLPPFQLKAQDQQQMWDQIRSQMDTTEAAPVKKSRFIYWYWAAAAVCIMAGAALWWMRPEKETAVVYTRLLKEAKLDGNRRIEEVNEESTVRTVRLPDGSSVVLEPGARISYPVCATNNCKREVYLSGAAFFEVSRNTLQPFIVYANEMVINVLGTSFHVKAYDKDSLVQVYVKTGKIALSVQPLGSKVISNVSANQQAILQRNTLAVSVQLPEQHHIELQAPEAITYSFVFNDAPVDSVMSTIENAYGVHIAYDKVLLADCRLTASLTDEPLYEKIRLICRALEADCIIKGNDITLSAKGCHRY